MDNLKNTLRVLGSLELGVEVERAGTEILFVGKTALYEH